MIFSIKVGEEEDLSSQPRNYNGMLRKFMDEFKFDWELCSSLKYTCTFLKILALEHFRCESYLRVMFANGRGEGH